MRDELIPFQKTAVANLLNEITSAVAYHKVDGRPQVIAFRAPTGSGKTIVMATVIEDILNGTETRIEQPEAIFVWLSDSPQLNEQSKMKIILKADKVQPSQCVTISEESFDQEMLEDGHIYFLNTQKLGKSSRLVSNGDSRTYTIWQTLQNTAEQKGDHLYIIIDEAHRGMQDKEAAKASTTECFHDPGDFTGGHAVDNHLCHACNERRFAARVVVKNQRLKRYIPVPGNFQDEPPNPGRQPSFPSSIPAVYTLL